jgi:hypothetical protein
VNRPDDDNHISLREYMDMRLTNLSQHLEIREAANQREHEKAAAAGQRAMEIASEELSRRLEILNGHQEELRKDRDRYVTQDVFTITTQEQDKRVRALEKTVWGAMAVVGVLWLLIKL